jgi:hypothetical protein
MLEHADVLGAKVSMSSTLRGAAAGAALDYPQAEPRSEAHVRAGGRSSIDALVSRVRGAA